MNPVITYEQDNGIVAICYPTVEALAKYGIDEIAKKDVPVGKAYKVVEVSTILSDRTFRDAWKPDLSVDMGKAVEITKNRLRSERAPLLVAQDVAFQQAIETGASITGIVTEKNRLRDVTKLADRPGISLDELKALQVVQVA